ncbi:GtrA family protein [Mesobacillus maritimus]|jgi:putative flippase GtrA|uniref:GtrA family protein n=1 Tax=Mesobacillus maritimus TaxID=1643336 RepID=A0ABS7K013_9BACI|nr:GtrA family protein [Mesobacillus maritimus]MBY0095586.1 GtrA family protein [Mesobacillus maritimus]
MIAVNSLRRTNSFFRFLLVGVINTIIGLSIMLILLNLFGWSYWLATFVGNCMGAGVSYILNRSFTFKSNINGSKGIPRFFFVILSCYIVSYSLGEIVAATIQLSSQTLSFISQDELAVLIGTVTYTLTNYIGQKTIVFRSVTEE